MTTPHPDPEATRPAGTTTIGDYRAMVGRQDRAAIADLIHGRFAERYLDAVLASPKRHGFAVMAVCCLMVEALESFRQGWPRTDRRSEAAFCSFFQAHGEFAEFRPLAHDFYRAVRCGILHQAETTDGWRVRRQGVLLLAAGGVHWVNAAEFAKRLRRVLNAYRESLKRDDWTSPLWVAARAKLRSSVRMREPPPLAYRGGGILEGPDNNEMHLTRSAMANGRRGPRR